MKITSILLLGLLVGCASTVRTAAPPTPVVAATGPGAHEVRLLVGGSFDRAGDGAALGAQYEYRKTPDLGFGAFGDVAFGRRTSTVLGGGVFWHPKTPWTVFAGPGVEFVRGDADVIARIGGAYAFDVDSYTLGPIAWIDLGDDVSLLLGIALGFDF